MAITLERLSGIEAKIARAKEHLETIETEAKNHLEAKPHQIVQHIDPSTGWNVLRPRPMSPLPLRWGVVAGDLVHDLRSALDHLIWQLVLASGAIPDEMNQFPIFSTGRVEKSQASNRRRRWSDYLHGVPAEATAVIKALQPYRRRMRVLYVPLERLAEFSNTDKHRTLVPSAAVMVPWHDMEFRFIQVPEGTRLAEVIPAKPGAMLSFDKAQLLAVRVDPPDSMVRIELQTPIRVSVAFGDNADFPLGNFRDFIEEVERVVKALRKFLV